PPCSAPGGTTVCTVWINWSSRQPIDGKVGLERQPGAVPPTSYAPISQVAIPSPLPSSGRGKPRWSVAGGGQSSPPASIAGLPGNSAWVGVGPPLSCSGPSCGSMLTRSPVPVNPQELPLSRLCPWDVKVPLPAQLSPERLSATIT